MNVHHLELFYYVARHGGISQAARNMPYGIQQPAISGQILQLEDYLGLTLFQRRPFELTQAGQELYEFIQPFFGNLEPMAEKLIGGATHLIRIAASPIILRDHLPAMLKNLRGKYPKLKLTMREGLQPDIEEWLAKQEIDLAVTAIEGRPPVGIKSQKLIDLPLVLLVNKARRIKSLQDITNRDRIDETLISLPSNEAVSRLFQKGLSKLGVDWPIGIEVNSLDLIDTYVENDFGIGVTVMIPDRKIPRNVRCLPLDDFGSIPGGAFWRGKLNPIQQALLGEVEKRAKALMNGAGKRA